MDILADGISTILGTGVGFLARLAPEIIKVFTAKGDRDHEFRMAQLSGQQAQAGYDARRDDARLDLEKMDIQAMIAATQAQARRSGIKLIDALSASVRPVISYWWMALFTAVKAASLYSALGQGNSIVVAVLGCWDGQDQTILASIISFWFLDRTMRNRVTP